MAPHLPQSPARKSRCPRRRLDDGQLAVAHRAASRTVAAASDHIALRQPRLCPRSHSSLRRIAAFCSGVHARLRPDPLKISSRRTGSPFDLCKSSVSDTWLTRFRLERPQTIAHSPTHLKVRSKGRLVRLSMSVSAPFVWRCLSGSAVAPFPHPAHRTGQADFPHPALGQDFTRSFACNAVCSF